MGGWGSKGVRQQGPVSLVRMISLAVVSSFERVSLWCLADLSFFRVSRLLDRRGAMNVKYVLILMDLPNVTKKVGMKHAGHLCDNTLHIYRIFGYSVENL